MLTAYHQILGLKENASKAEIKSAYRMLAKKFHPDVNKSKGSKEVFIKITEAYEFLMHDNAQEQPKNKQAQYAYRDKIYKEWIKNNQAQAHAKGTRYADMKYGEYKKTVADEAPLLYYGFKLMGCLTTAVILLIVLLLLAWINPILGGLFVMAFIPLAALIMTVGEKHIKIKDLLKYFK